jgi:ABC-type multidrug transport system ATPase subunit
MSILTGDLLPSSGTAAVKGHDIITQMQKVRQIIGYCPQFDPLLELMTAREHLYLFARLKGVPLTKVDQVVESLIVTIGLKKFADKPCGSYSGGNKRKLSLGLALIGNPALVLLDEPSSGMDPVSRRFMWEIIRSVKNDKSIVLTTHSMEECEALCDRVGIMVSGKLRCIGSIQHLKAKYGKGYKLDIKLRDSLESSNQEELKNLIEKCFKGACLEEEFPLFLKYEIPSTDCSLANIFGIIESKKVEFEIEDYNISQTSLEQIFLSIVKSYDKQYQEYL